MTVLLDKINWQKDCVIPLEVEFEILGGTSRRVYKLSNYDIVIKELIGDTVPSPNLIEWLVWQKVKNTNISHFFCPVINISIDTRYLAMPYAPKNSRRFKKWLYSSKLDKNKIYKIIDPVLCNDITRFQQWGELNGNFVIVDYGSKKNLKYVE